MANSIDNTLDENQQKEQTGFYMSLLTINHIYTLNHAIKKTNECKNHLILAFINYEKKFNSAEISVVVEAIK